MPRYIIHNEGVYNFYTTVADGACYEGGLTLEELTDIVRTERGIDGLRDLPERLGRAHKTGCSGFDCSLDECIDTNRSGPAESAMPRAEFIHRYLTLRASDSAGSTPAQSPHDTCGTEPLVRRP